MISFENLTSLNSNFSKSVGEIKDGANGGLGDCSLSTILPSPPVGT